MLLANYPVKCTHCGESTTVQVNLFNGEHKIISATKIKFNYGEVMEIVSRFKKLNGFDAQPNWDRLHKGRNIKAAKNLLLAFAGLPDSLGVALECLEDTAREAEQIGFTWALETVVKRSAAWLAKKQGAKI